MSVVLCWEAPAVRSNDPGAWPQPFGRCDVEQGTKCCPHCEITKPVEEFGVKRDARDGRQSWCKDCHNLRRRGHVLAPPLPAEPVFALLVDRFGDHGHWAHAVYLSNVDGTIADVWLDRLARMHRYGTVPESVADAICIALRSHPRLLWPAECAALDWQEAVAS